MLTAMQLRFSHRRYSLAFRDPVRTAHGIWERREGCLVRLESEAGQVGVGEIAPVPGFGGISLDAVAQRLGSLAPWTSTAQVRQAAALGGVMGFGLGSALADLDQVDSPAASHLPVAGLLPAGTAAFSAAATKLELGFRTFKWKVGVEDPQDEQVMLDDLLSRLPEGSRVRLDANGAWDRRVAERWLEVCAQRSMIEYVEQPCDPRDRDLALGLARDYPTTLALDEAVADKAEMDEWRDLGWPGVYVIKPALWGDPTLLASELASPDLDVVLSSALETRVGAKAWLRLAFSGGGGQRTLGAGVWPLFEEPLFDGPAAMPFVHWSEVQLLDLEAVWNELS